MERIQAVLFDLDNTILDRTSTFSRFVDSILAEYFGHVDAAAQARIHKRIVELDDDGYKNKEEMFAELLGELPWREAPSLDELLAFYKAEYVSSAVPMERAEEVVDRLRAKYRTGLITNGRTAIQHGKIDRLGMRGGFDVILVSEEAGIRKPDAAIFELAASRLQLRPDQCLFVGDHPANDIAGAAGAGMETIWMRVNQPWPDGLRASPRHTIRALSELLELL